LKYPILAETYSHLRYSYRGYGGYDFYAKLAKKPDVIVRIGTVPISKALNEFINESNAKYIYHFDETSEWSDDSHVVTHLIPSSGEALIGFQGNIEREHSVLSTQYLALEKTHGKPLTTKLKQVRILMEQWSMMQ
jgi:2-succinyl-5-enolpyruvyl-6-hydroxy-3-cyclohexene-1-carboxylate synthase